MRRPAWQRRGLRRLGFGLLPLLVVALIALCLAPGGGLGCARRESAGEGAAARGAGRPAAAGEPNLLSFSRIEQAWAHGGGDGVLVAVCDWQFDLRGKAAQKYVHPVSLVEGQPIGKLKPWHGEWMAEIVHTVAPGAKIIPIKARGLNEPQEDAYEARILAGIRYAADHGAAAVTSSMGPLRDTPQLREAIDYAEARGTIFVDVHPEYRVGEDGQKAFPAAREELDPRIVHTGVVSVPAHAATPKPSRDLYTWPYDLEIRFEDGWGYSNAPPAVAGVIALMKGANPALAPADVRRILKETAALKDGFPVLDAAAAVAAVAAAAAAEEGGGGRR